MPTYQERKNHIVFNLSDIKTNHFFTKDTTSYLNMYYRYEKIFPDSYRRSSDTLKYIDTILIQDASYKISQNNNNVNNFKKMWSM